LLILHSNKSLYEKMKVIVTYIIVLCMMITGTVGCAPVLPINAVSVAGGTAPVVYNSLGRGKGDSYWMARYDDVMAATLRAAKALSLELIKEDKEKDKALYRFCDDDSLKIDIEIRRRTDTMTSVLFDVGWFGSVSFGRLFARQVSHELQDAGAFLEDWTVEKQ
jgi:hypothetical protein